MTVTARSTPIPTSPWLRRGGAVVLPIVLFLVLRPETYGLVPNWVDPPFYTGLAINLEDSLAAGAEAHYAISRWSAWYPLHLAHLAAGPSAGRLLVRLVLAALAVHGLWALRPEWTWPQRLLTGTVLVTMPLFVRAVFTDYVEYAIVGYGLALVLMVLRHRGGDELGGAVADSATRAGRADPTRGGVGTGRAAVAGGLAGLLVVANPFAATVAAGPLVALSLAARGWRRRLASAVVAGGSTVVVVLAGALWFRLVHGIDDIYGPTIEFIVNEPGVDAFRSARSNWVGLYTWIYLPPLLVALVALVAAGALSRRVATPRFDRLDVTAVLLVVVQYLVQVVDQIFRPGVSLELSYYWSMIYPAFGVALALVLGRFAAGIPGRWSLGLTAAWVAVLGIGVPDPLRLPPGAGYALAATVVLTIVVVGVRWSRTVPTALWLALVVWSQVGAPRFDPTAYENPNVVPRYDELFGSSGDHARAVFGEMRWFDRQMDRVPADHRTYYLPVGPRWARSLVSLAQAQTTRHDLTFDPEPPLVPDDEWVRARVEGTHVAVVGPPDQVHAAEGLVQAKLGVDSPILDQTHESDLGYRLAVYELPALDAFPLEIEADSLFRARGEVQGDDVLVTAGTEGGIVTYGPYLPLQPGRYRVTLRYRSPAPRDAIVGEFRSTGLDGTVDSEVDSATPLEGTSGRPGVVTLELTVGATERVVEFPTVVSGEHDVVIDAVVLTGSTLLQDRRRDD